MTKRNDKKTVPELRFRGFTDPWEQRQLGEVAEKVTEKNSGLVYQQVLTNSATHGIVRQSEYFDRIVAGKNHLDAYYVVNPNDYVYNPRISKEAQCGPINRNTLELTGIASPLYLVFRVSPQSLAYEFLDQYFKTANWFNYMKLQGNSGARSDRFTIADSDFFSMPVRIPSLPEQRRIGEFFSTLDSLIAAAERQEALLKQKKQAYLQLMFPREGETQPRLRFSGFSSDWEQRQLGDVCARRSTQAVSSACLPSVEYDDVVAGGGVFVSDFVPKLGKRGIRFESGDVLFGKLRPYLGNRLHPDFNGVAVGDWWVLAPLHADSSFLFSIVQSPKFCMVANQSSGSKMPRADWKLVSSEVFGIPSLPEQRLIGRFFSTLDSLIAAAEERTRALKEMKSAYLQRMFV